MRWSRTVPLALAAVVIATGILLVARNASGRWPRPEIGMLVADLPMPAFVAREASIGERRDTRSSGLVLRHSLLRLAGVSQPRWISTIPAGSTLVYTQTDELTERVRAVLDGDIPVERRFEATFAIGRPAPALLVRVGSDRRIASVEDVRVTFVALSLP